MAVTDEQFTRLEDRVNDSLRRTNTLEGAYKHLATREDVADVKTELAKSENRIVKWIVGLAVTILFGMLVQTSLLWRAILSLSG